MIKIIFGLTASLMMLPLLAMAQERSAAGSVDTQMTWSALKSLVDSAVTKSDAVNARMDQAVLCGKKGMVYAPGGTNADATGCKAATTPDPSKLDLKSYTETMCTRNDGPFSVVSACKPGEVLLTCSGGPGDQDENGEYWVLEPDYINKLCTGRVKKPRCWTDKPRAGEAYYSQVIVTATCYKP